MALSYLLLHVDVKKVSYFLHVVIFPLSLLSVVSQACCNTWLENNMYFPNKARK